MLDPPVCLTLVASDARRLFALTTRRARECADRAHRLQKCSMNRRDRQGEREIEREKTKERQRKRDNQQQQSQREEEEEEQRDKEIRERVE